ncbi:hypothetical protein [Tropicibacter naphthalenivorans]|uniref:Uncharacterized protein n=1 Tax=Tropicibacter naphthalenivorans TaxID=441103 RepID=A0A0P1GGJ0_9RHOB|nr:hypothetical protein [Tropicibacter naphthalenivorans]CUH80720.1 hypothetical protein TRN7648_03111 [Tropicibacter naphthalenivorans]SMC89549.1 hypothetical protein SAMN04488093_10681 [Tropicibacter naphthalenivorans]
MAALTSDRNTPARVGDNRQDTVAANVRIFAGALLMRDAAGNLTPGATATGATGVGRAEEAVDNTGGAAGALSVPWCPGVFQALNHGPDAVSASDLDGLCYFVDDQTVAATDGTGTRSPAGIVEAVTSTHVWVRFDAGLTRAAAGTS